MTPMIVLVKNKKMRKKNDEINQIKTTKKLLTISYILKKTHNIQVH